MLYHGMGKCVKVKTYSDLDKDGVDTMIPGQTHREKLLVNKSATGCTECVSRLPGRHRTA